jgi:competence protein ComEC
VFQPGSAALRTIRIAAAFHAGVVAIDRPGPQQFVLALIVGAAALGLLPPGRRRGSGPIRTLATLAIAGFAGAAVAGLAADAPPPDFGSGSRWEDWIEVPATVTGTVSDTRLLHPDRIELLIAAERIEVAGRAGPISRPIGIRLTLPRPEAAGTPPWPPGERLRLTARLSAPRAFGNPGAFDYPAWLRARGIRLVGSVKSALLVERLDRGRWRPAGWSARVRAAVIRRIERAGPHSAPFLAALLVGDRSAIDPAIEEPLQCAGIYHIVALSGLNVAWLAAVAAFGSRLLAIPAPAARGWVMGALAGYWWVAPASGSMGRATLMGLLYLAGRMTGRRVTPAAALGTAGILMLIGGPAWVADPGYQLSVAATLGILVVGGRPDGRRVGEGWRRLPRLAAEASRVSLGALAGTLLIGAHHFQRVVPASLPANLIAVPCAAVLLVLAAGLAILGGSPGILVRPMAALADGLLGALVTSAGFVAAIPGLSFRVVPPSGLSSAGALAALMVGWAGGRRPARAAGRVAFALLAIGMLAAGWWPPAPGILRVVALDVGQGDAIVVELPSGATMLVDAGGRTRSGFDFGDAVVAPALRSLRHLRIDLLVVTHAHQDHLGGAAAILRQFRPAAVWVGRVPSCDPRARWFEAEAARIGVPVVVPRRGLRTRFGGVEIDVLNPGGAGAAPDGPAANNDSIVLLARLGEREVLLTGDIEAEVERSLVERGADLAADLIKIAHHGSRSSTGAEFLRRVRPKEAIVSSGRGNPWGHPDPEVLDRLRRAGARIWRTDQDGAACLQTDGRGPWRWCGRPFRSPRGP